MSAVLASPPQQTENPHRRRSYAPTYKPPTEDDRWTWSDDLPFRREDLVGANARFLTPHERRIIGEPTLALWRTLERMRGAQQKKFPQRLWYAARVSGLTLKQAYRALERLAEIGVVQKRYSHERNRRHEWRTTLVFRVLGSWDRRRGTERVLWPGGAVDAWLPGRRGRGRPKKRWASAPPVSGVEEGGPTTGLRELGQKDGQCIYNNNGHFVGEQETRRAVPRATFFSLRGTDAMPQTPKPSSPLPGESTEAWLYRSQPSAPKRTPVRYPEVSELIAQGKPYPNIPEMDPPVFDRSNDDILLSESTPLELNVRNVIEAYRRGVQQVFGVRYKGFLRGDPAQSPMYQRLSDAVKELLAADIAPSSWCRWVLEYAKEKGSARPLPLQAVFDPYKIYKQRGFFRRTRESSYNRDLNMELRIEQMLRKDEAIKLWRGMPPERALLYMHEPYVQMREREIKAGYSDPLTLWPTKRKGGVR